MPSGTELGCTGPRNPHYPEREAIVSRCNRATKSPQHALLEKYVALQFDYARLLFVIASLTAALQIRTLR